MVMQRSDGGTLTPLACECRQFPIPRCPAMHEIEGEFCAKLSNDQRLPPEGDGRKGGAGFKPDRNRFPRQQACHPASTNGRNRHLAVRASQFCKKIAQHRLGAGKVLILWMEDQETHSLPLTAVHT